MAKCGLCSKKKGKRFCAPLNKIICPICCAENRGLEIDCSPDCRYLEGVAFQKKKEEEKKYAKLMNEIGHGQFDDIFQQPPVAMMAYDIESLVRDITIKKDFEISDTLVSEAYKLIYKIHSEQEQIETRPLNPLAQALFDQYETLGSTWKKDLDEKMIEEVYLRLMISVKRMTGGTMGNKGYLNYLKNNLSTFVPEN